jgi:hypothetical protein
LSRCVGASSGVRPCLRMILLGLDAFRIADDTLRVPIPGWEATYAMTPTGILTGKAEKGAQESERTDPHPYGYVDTWRSQCVLHQPLLCRQIGNLST